MRYITGVGSRETPKEIIPQIREIFGALKPNEWTLRSGGADGADTFFETTANEYRIKTEIFLPWKNFNGNKSTLWDPPSQEAYDLASNIHPAWSKLSPGAKTLHARNCYQVLGKDLKTPSDLVVCWTKNGEKVGGTRTAMVLAEQRGIPIFNLSIQSDKDVINWLKRSDALDELSALDQELGLQ